MAYQNSPYGGYGGPGGFSSGMAQAGLPPGADPQLWSWFSAVDTDRSGAISAIELERALINGDWTPFDLDTVKLLMGMFDVDRSGTIGFNEFCGLWKYIKDWQNVFRYFDRDRSGTIDRNELRDALSRFGYNLSPPLIKLIQVKYGMSPIHSPIRVMHLSHCRISAETMLIQDIQASNVASNYGPAPGITFDRFVRACVVIKQLSGAFQNLDTDNDGWVQISYDQFMQTVLSLP
ncbi:hypothetical protein C8R48DRAFT_772201 [Suillus tomentosus]|nr:hypothetical protein C8R48DRAFT_772201 [Suillus tomentosus]